MNRILLFFVFIMFWVFVGDTIMSYVTPVLIETQLGSTFWMGVIIGSSSMFGIVCDLVFGRLFEHRSYAFFVKCMFFFLFLFPLIFLVLPPLVIFFVLAMASWGIYFEFGRFSQYHFIHTYLHIRDHARAWGILESMRSMTFVVGSLLAPWLLDFNMSLPLYGALATFMMGFLFFLIFSRHYPIYPKVLSPGALRLKTQPSRRTALKEIKIWTLLAQRVWPLLIFEFALVLVEACVWTIGVLFSEELRSINWWSGLLIPAYAVAGVLMPLLAQQVAQPLGKKRAALITGILGGCLFTVGGLFVPPTYFVGIMFLATLFHSLTYPELYATFEDFLARLRGADNELVGLESSVNSLAYIVGPILAGLVATFVGNQATFAVFGSIMVVAGLVALLAMPRKIKMPQHKIDRVLQS